MSRGNTSHGSGTPLIRTIFRDGIAADIQFVQRLIERFTALEHTKTYDLLAALPLIVWYGICVAVRLPALMQEVRVMDFGAVDLRTVLILSSKLTTLVFFGTLIALLIFRDKPRAKAAGLMPRAAAIAGTYLSVGLVLLPPVNLPYQLYFVSTLLIAVGTSFALYSATYLGQSISMMSEARRLVVHGPYAVVRHPLYLGEGIALIGLTLQVFSLSALLILVLQCACQIIRMDNEEHVLLRTFPDYRSYMVEKARLIPHLY